MTIPNDRTDRPNAVLADRYRTGRQLGAGGMATVYLTEDLKHARKVAVKVLEANVPAPAEIRVSGYATAADPGHRIPFVQL